MGFEITTLVVIGTDYIGSYKSNCPTIMTTTVPFQSCKHVLWGECLNSDAQQFSNYQQIKRTTTSHIKSLKTKITTVLPYKLLFCYFRFFREDVKCAKNIRYLFSKKYSRGISPHQKIWTVGPLWCKKVWGDNSNYSAVPNCLHFTVLAHRSTKMKLCDSHFCLIDLLFILEALPHPLN